MPQGSLDTDTLHNLSQPHASLPGDNAVPRKSGASQNSEMDEVRSGSTSMTAQYAERERRNITLSVCHNNAVDISSSSFSDGTPMAQLNH